MTAGALPATRAYGRAAELERMLGGDGDPMSVRTLVDADENDEFPHPALAAVHDWGFAEELIPVHLGGKLESHEQLFAAFRALARRDPRLGVYYGSTLLAALPVWLWGDPERQQWLAGELRAGACGTFAMSETDHGSDLLNCTVSARRVDGGYVVDGTKWLVGNGNRGSFVTLYARTGTKSYSLLLLDKAALPADRWEPVEPVPTLGIRGHDLSGLRFDSCPVQRAVVLGREGSGVAMALKTLQLTRTLIAGFALGCLDAALRITLRHAHGRRLYGASITELPEVRAILVDAYLDLLIGECTAIAVTRAVATVPSRLSMWSSIAKYLVPTIAEDAVANLATVLSARRYLRTELTYRHFQKVERDLAIAGIFEGTTHVNLASIAAQLPHVLSHGRRDDQADDELLAQLFSRGSEPAHWRPSGSALRLTNGLEDEVTAGWPRYTRQALSLIDPGLHAELASIIGRLDVVREGVLGGIVDAGDGTRRFTLARSHALLHGASSVLLTWIHGRDALPSGFRGGEWVVLALDRIARRLHTDQPRNDRLAPAVFELMCGQERAGELFSLQPLEIVD